MEDGKGSAVETGEPVTVNGAQPNYKVDISATLNANGPVSLTGSSKFQGQLSFVRICAYDSKGNLVGYPGFFDDDDGAVPLRNFVIGDPTNRILHVRG